MTTPQSEARRVFLRTRESVCNCCADGRAHVNDYHDAGCAWANGIREVYALERAAEAAA